MNPPEGVYHAPVLDICPVGSKYSVAIAYDTAPLTMVILRYAESVTPRGSYANLTAGVVYDPTNVTSNRMARPRECVVVAPTRTHRLLGSCVLAIEVVNTSMERAAVDP